LSENILKTIAAFFDVDGTLFTGHVWRGMLKYFQDTRGKWPVRWFWYYHMPSYFLRKAKLISEERFRGPWAKNLTWLARGWRVDQLQGMYDWVAHTYSAPLRREDTIAKLAEHNAQGHLTVLVSTGFTGLIDTIGQTVGAQIAIGTDIKMKDGHATGGIIPPLVIGAQKGIETKKRLAARGLDVDFENSFAYADSITDLGLFEMVGNPRPVYPDAELAALAKSKGWPIYGEAKKIVTDLNG
jgi:HAD superfamily hydrolase (TIGR01490 family)